MEKYFHNKLLVGIVAVLAIAAFFTASYFLTNTPKRTSYPNVNKLSPNDHIKWSPAKKIILVEYSDLQCPACKLYHDAMLTDIEKNPQNSDILKNITLVYRHFPLTNIHPHALEAAYAAEAAGKQGKFFEMVNLLFSKQANWAERGEVVSYFADRAKELKLNVDQFKKDMGSEDVKNRIQADEISGSEADLNATPTFYLNGKKLDNIASLDEFKNILRDEISAMKK